MRSMPPKPIQASQALASAMHAAEAARARGSRATMAATAPSAARKKTEQKRVAQPMAPATAAVVSKRKRKTTATHERVVVTAVIAFGFAAAVLGSVRVAGDVRETRAKELMQGTFTRVDAHQDEFRRVNARFATWTELAARGVRLPARQQVRTASADQSHWYLSLRDRNTGVVCDRIGELFDDPDGARAPVCRAPGDSTKEPALAAGPRMRLESQARSASRVTTARQDESQ